MIEYCGCQEPTCSTCYTPSERLNQPEIRALVLAARELVSHRTIDWADVKKFLPYLEPFSEIKEASK